MWYSGYSPNFDLVTDATGRSTPGEQYCLSSLPLSSQEYFLYFLSVHFRTDSDTLSDNVFPFLDGRNE